MSSFLLSSPPRRGGQVQSFAFEAADAGAALSIAFRHVRNRPADLWCDGQLLCRIQCPEETGGFWLIS